MKVSNETHHHAADATRGRTATNRARQGLQVIDSLGNDFYPTQTLKVAVARDLGNNVTEIGSEGTTVIGTVSTAGSATVSSGTDHRAFPGVAWLDNHTATEHIAGDRFLIVYRHGSDHDFSVDGKIVGKIGTITDAATWTYSLGSEFDIEDVANDLRGCALVSIVDISGAGDYRVTVYADEYNGTANSAVHLLISNVSPGSFTSAGTWTRHNVTLTAGANENVASGHAYRLQSGGYLLPAYWISGATVTTGVLLIADITNPATHTTVSIATGYNEIHIVQQADGSLDAHLRNSAHTYHYHSRSSDSGATWSTPTQLYAAGGFPAWAVLTSGIGVAVNRSVPTQTISDWDTAMRQTQYGADDTGWGSETIIDATAGYHSAYADILQLDDNHALIVYAVESDVGVIVDSDIYSVVLADSTVFGTGSSVVALDDLSDVQTSGAVAGAVLIFDGTAWRPGYAGIPLILEDGTVAILEDGTAAMSEYTFL